MPNTKLEQYPFDEDGFRFLWSPNSLGAFMKCPRYYYYTSVKSWQPTNKSVHLIFGGIYATALEHFYLHQAKGMSDLDALDAVVDEALQATWIRTEDDEEGTPWISGHDKKTRETLIRTIIWYIDQYVLSPEGDQTEVVTLNNGKPAIELTAKLELYDDIVWHVKLDRMATYNGDIYVMDQKTTGSALSAYYFKGFALDVQMSGYAYTGKIAYNLPVKGVIIDAAHILVGGTKYGRGFVNRSEAQLDEFQHYAKYYIEQARIAHKTGYYPMNTASCMNYGGCAFHKICERSPEHRANFLAADFERRDRWEAQRK